MAQEFKHLFFHYGEVVHLRHETVDGANERFQNIKIPQLIMRHQVYQTGITLQVVPEIGVVVNDLLQIVDTSAVIAAAKMQNGDLIGQNHHAVLVYKERIFLHALLDGGHRLEPFFKGAQDEMPVDLGLGNIEEALNAEVVVFLN